MLKNLAIVLGLVAGLSACVGPYGYDGYGGTGYGYNQPAYYGYGYNRPAYYGYGYNTLGYSGASLH
jgi:hypothetical protein